MSVITARQKYILTGLLGAIADGMIVAFATKAIPKMMSNMMTGMMKDMMQMREKKGIFRTSDRR